MIYVSHVQDVSLSGSLLIVYAFKGNPFWCIVLFPVVREIINHQGLDNLQTSSATENWKVQGTVSAAYSAAYHDVKHVCLFAPSGNHSF